LAILIVKACGNLILDCFMLNVSVYFERFIW